MHVMCPIKLETDGGHFLQRDLPLFVKKKNLTQTTTLPTSAPSSGCCSVDEVHAEEMQDQTADDKIRECPKYIPIRVRIQVSSFFFVETGEGRQMLHTV